MNPKVYIVVLHYKGGEDTVEGLLSLNGLSHRNFEAVVVDNGSGDGSFEYVRAAVDGKLNYPWHAVSRAENGGFAVGMNAGLAFARARGDGRYYWLLNNDVSVDQGALSALVAAAEDDRAAGRRVGQYGSKLLYHVRPELIQAVGGRYNKWFGVTREIGNRERDLGQYDDPAPAADILIGAAIFASEDFVREVGPLGEDYFIYFEEHDWAERGRRKGWGLRTVPQSVVRHKQGAAIGAHGLEPGKKSAFSDFYSFRNRLRLTARFYPYALPTVLLGFLPTAFLRLKRGQADRLPLLLKAVFTFLGPAGPRPAA